MMFSAIPCEVWHEIDCNMTLEIYSLILMNTNRALPPLNALRAFEATGRRLSFRAAADELGVTQGAVAQQVRALEDKLGFPLFLRQRRGVLLTDRGHAYFAEVHRPSSN